MSCWTANEAQMDGSLFNYMKGLVPLFKFMIFQKLYFEVQNIIIIHMILTTYFILSSFFLPYNHSNI